LLIQWLELGSGSARERLVPPYLAGFFLGINTRLAIISHMIYDPGNKHWEKR
jgi:hypothetical protein